MTLPPRRTVTVLAVVVLMATLPLAAQIADVRAAQATERTTQDLLQHQVTTRHAPADYDGDGIPDATDRCPTRPETQNGFQDDDGCPDVVTGTGAS